MPDFDPSSLNFDPGPSSLNFDPARPLHDYSKMKAETIQLNQREEIARLNQANDYRLRDKNASAVFKLPGLIHNLTPPGQG